MIDWHTPMTRWVPCYKCGGVIPYGTPYQMHPNCLAEYHALMETLMAELFSASTTSREMESPNPTPQNQSPS